MIIDKIGTYRLLEAFSARGPRSIAQIPKGNSFQVKQIDRQNHKVYVVDWPDWVYWNIPAEAVEE